MPIQTFTWDKFSSGWCPSDDAINGRQDAFLRMDNVELDKNGAISLSSGTSQISHFGDTNANDLYSRFIGSTRHDYTGLVNGKVYRDSTLLSSGGGAVKTAFGTAFGQVLIASANYRVKDIGSGTPAALGVGIPAGQPSLVGLTYVTPPILLTAHLTSNVEGTAAYTTSGPNTFEFSFKPDGTSNRFTYQGYNNNGAQADLSTLTQNSIGSTTTPMDPNDQLRVELFAVDGSYNRIIDSAILLNVQSIEIQFFFAAPPVALGTPTDYYTYSWDQTVGANSVDVINSTGSSIALTPRRYQFARIGGSSNDWPNVIGYSIIITCNAPITTVQGLYFQQYFQGGHAGQLSGLTTYMQVNVNNNGSYLAKSAMGPIVTSQNFYLEGFQVTYYAPTDPQVNEVWIFRLIGGIWYRVIKMIPPTFAAIDVLSNDDALVLNITYNPNLISISTAGVTDPIYEILGPISGRWWYFTNQFIYPSDINDPDLIDPTIAIRSTDSTTEIFLWARKLTEGTILVGTSCDIYVMSGTFVTLPDGSIDVYYRPTSCKFPPISRDATVYAASVYYMADTGWRSLDLGNILGGGTNPSIVVPNTDILYGGFASTPYGYTGPTINGIAPGSNRFPIVFAKNKLWCCITGTGRIEVYDFIRKYWRNISYVGFGDASAIFGTQDGQIIAYYGNGNYLRTIDDQTTLILDGITKQIVSILSVAEDAKTPRQRKDLSTLKSGIFTNGDNLPITLLTDVGVYLIGNLNSSSLNSETFLDVSQIIPIAKWWQFQLIGAVGGLNISDISIDADARPIPLTFLRNYNNNYGTGVKKRRRAWPFVIDTRGQNVTFTPIADNVNLPSQVFNTNEKTTVLYQIKTDIIAIDWGSTLLLAPGGIYGFEFWGELPPDFVQVFPIARRFDQVGPQELFRYGRIEKIEYRLLPYGISIPFNIYLNDISMSTGIIDCISGQENSYFINCPKGTSGSILRIELGPTNFDFHRFYARALVILSGTDKEGQWIPL